MVYILDHIFPPVYASCPWMACTHGRVCPSNQSLSESGRNECASFRMHTRMSGYWHESASALVFLEPEQYARSGGAELNGIWQTSDENLIMCSYVAFPEYQIRVFNVKWDSDIKELVLTL